MTAKMPRKYKPLNLLSQKTALFGMTRTGKSNATEIIDKAIYNLRVPINEYTQKFDAPPV